MLLNTLESLLTQTEKPIIVMNSAVMPDEGCYYALRITQDEFSSILREYAARELVKSYIGYPSTLNFVNKISGCNLELSRESVVLDEQGVILVCRLSYRMQDPSTKKTHEPSEEDFEFFAVIYNKNISKSFGVGL